MWVRNKGLGNSVFTPNPANYGAAQHAAAQQSADPSLLARMAIIFLQSSWQLVLLYYGLPGLGPFKQTFAELASAVLIYNPHGGEWP